MTVKIYKHRMTRSLGLLFVILFLMVSWQVQAAQTCTKWWVFGCLPYTPNCLYTNQLEAAQANLDVQNSVDALYMRTAISCDGKNTCIYNYAHRGYSDSRNLSFSVLCSGYEDLTITLSGDTTSEPWHKKRDPDRLKANLPYKAIVKDQNGQPKANISVTITTDVTSDSGGHVHTNGRPKGKLAVTSVTIKDGKETLTGTTNGSGMFEFTFGAEEASGKHKLTATCTDCNEPAKPANIEVKVKEAEAPDWKTIPASPLYALQESGGEVIGAIPGVHTDNHYLTGAAIGKLGELAKIYQTVNPGQRLYLNDSSLEWGGLFDVGSTRWKTPHAGHRRGKVIDIRAANSSPVKEGAIPLLLWNEFSKEAAKQKIKAELHCFEQANLVIGPQCYFVPESRHFHVQLFSGVDQ